MKSVPISASRVSPTKAAKAGLTSTKRNAASCSDAGNGESQTSASSSCAGAATLRAAEAFGAEPAERRGPGRVGGRDATGTSAAATVPLYSSAAAPCSARSCARLISATLISRFSAASRYSNTDSPSAACTIARYGWNGPVFLTSAW